MKKDTLLQRLKHHPNRTLLSIIPLFVLLVAGAIFAVAISRNQEVRQRASGGTSNLVDIFMNPDTARVKYQDYQSFTLSMNTHAYFVGRADLFLKFNPAQIYQITFAKGSALTYATTTPTIVVDYAAGTAHITLHTATATGEKGANLDIGTLRVRQKGVGASSIVFSKTGTTTTSKIFAKNRTVNIAGALNGVAITGYATTANVDINFNSATDTLARNVSRTYALSINPNGGRVSKAVIHFTYNKNAIAIQGFAKGAALPNQIGSFVNPGNGTASVTLESTAGHPLTTSGILGNLTIKQIGTVNSSISLAGTVITQTGNPANAAGTLGTLSIRYPAAPTPIPTGTPIPSAPAVTWNCSGTTPVAILTWTGGTSASNGFTVSLKRGSNTYSFKVASRLHSVTSNYLRLNGNGATLTLAAGQTFVANVKGSAQGANTRTITVPPCASNYAIFLVKLDGVSDDSATGAKMTALFQTNGSVTKRTTLPEITLAYDGNGVYRGQAAIPGSFPAGTKFNVLVRGEKHLITTFTHLTGQPTRCNDGQLITMPNANPVTFNFTTVPLPPGDTVPQNNVVDTTDITRIENLLNKASTDLTDADLNVGDLNYDGKVTFIDLGLIYKTILVSCPQY